MFYTNSIFGTYFIMCVIKKQIGKGDLNKLIMIFVCHEHKHGVMSTIATVRLIEVSTSVGVIPWGLGGESVLL